MLGVPRDADTLTIRQAFRTLVMAHHPDRHAEPGATQRLQRINASFAVLSDTTLREAFDRGLKVEPPRLDEASGFEGLMGTIVDRFFGIRDERPVNGRHYRYDLDLSFETACLGGEVELALPVEERCSHCDGRGFPLESLPIICPACKGASSVRTRRNLQGVIQHCQTCSGRGYIIESACQHCAGSGVQTTIRPLRIDVPPATEHGAQLRIRGAGEAGRDGGRDGDCLVHIRVLPHPYLRRCGFDIEMERPVSVLRAMVGGWIQVPTLDGVRRVKLPARSLEGAVLRMSGHGVSSPGGPRGDQLVTIRVEMPQQVTSKFSKDVEVLLGGVDEETFPEVTAFEVGLGERVVGGQLRDES